MPRTVSNDWPFGAAKATQVTDGYDRVSSASSHCHHWSANTLVDRQIWLRSVVCAFVAFGKVLSPQFLIWLIPLVPLVRGRRGLAASALLAAALLLTQLWFPFRYWDLVLHFGTLESWLVLLRDLVLVSLFAVLLWPNRPRLRDSP